VFRFLPSPFLGAKVALGELRAPNAADDTMVHQILKEMH
jgi:hypothetical protein